MPIKGTMFKREAFANFPDDLLVQRFLLRKGETLDFTIELSLTRDLASDGKYEQKSLITRNASWKVLILIF